MNIETSRLILMETPVDYHVYDKLTERQFAIPLSDQDILQDEDYIDSYLESMTNLKHGLKGVSPDQLKRTRHE